MKEVKILVIRNFTVEPLLDDINEKLKRKNLKAKFFISGYDNSINELINKKSNFYNFKPDIILFFFSIDAYFKNISIKNNLKIHNKIRKDLALILSELKKNFVSEIGVCNYYGSLEKKNLNLCKSLNKKIQFFCDKNSNFNILDINKILKPHFFDSGSIKFWKQSMYPFNFESGKKISNLLFKFVSLKNGKFHKIIILDADNTLWPGIIGEDNFTKIKIKNKKKEYSYYSFQQDLKKLKNRGVLLAICSKNNLKDLKLFFKVKLKSMPLNIKDFSYLKVNWKNKSENILQLLKDINLSPENALFVDDSEYEIGEVKSRIPNLDTLLIPNKITDLKNLFSQKGNFDTNKITSEDKKRSKLYLDENKRKKIVSKFKDNDDYIKSLKIVLEIKLNCKKNISRLSQMTQKTNQFNSTTLRLNEKKILKLILGKDYLIYQCKAKDNYGDYGIIGLTIIKIIQKSNLAKIENTLFSCRALGRKIEEYFYQKIFNDIKKKNIQFVEFNYIKSEKNKLFSDFLRKYNFSEKKLNNRIIFFKKDIRKIDFTKNKKLIKYC